MSQGWTFAPETMTASHHFLYRHLPNMVRKRLDDWRKDSSSINILITGKTGIGKSTLVNGLVGKVIAKEGGTLQATTDKVDKSSKKISGVDVNVWDSPGLQDETANEDEYLADIKLNCKDKIDLFIYCHDMSENRFDDGGTDVTAMKRLTETLGENVWENGIVVLTMANMTVNDATVKFRPDQDAISKEVSRVYDLWNTSIRSALERQVKLNKDLASTIPIVHAGHYCTPYLLETDHDPWLSTLWNEAMKVCKPSAQPAFIKINEHRLKFEHNKSHRVQDLLHQQFISCVSMARKIGAQLGIPAHIVENIGISDGAVQSVLLYMGLNNGYVKMNDLESAEQADHLPDREPID